MLSCLECQKTFACKQNWKYHVDKLPCQKKVCKNCKKRFTTSSSFKYHIDNKVCLKKNNQIDYDSSTKPLSSKINSDIDISSMKELDNEQLKMYFDFRLEMKKLENEHERIALEKAKMKNKILIKLRANKPTINVENNVTNNTNNTNNINLNLVTFGSENPDALRLPVLETISRKPKQGFTDIGVKALYFNPKYPENQIVKAKYPHSNKAEYFNGKIWQCSTKQQIAELILDSLVESIKKRYKELPRNDSRIDRLFDQTMNYIGDHLDDDEESLEHSKVIANNLTNLWRQLEHDNRENAVENAKND